ncbi:MAG TPA: DUF1501 domain-containing protein [Anaerolineales bacterium]|nr:DUF1501 domain-containing protein [Anaerolineales bacterium]
MSAPSDRDLIQRARRGETEAFGELVTRYQTSAFNVCYRILHERAEAEDMAQESFIRAHERLSTFDEERPFGPGMRGVDDERGPASGWIGRHLATLNTGNSSPLRAVGMGTRPQRSLSGTVPVSALRSIADFHLGGDQRALQQMRVPLNTVYADDVPGQDTLSIMDRLERLDPLAYTAARSAKYPDTEFGLALKQTAMLIKAEVGLEVSAIDVGGWDTHFAQGSTSGLMPNLMEDLAEGLAAFHADMFDRMRDLTTVSMSEFGRRASENGSLGTDHGHECMMMVLGGNVNGGKVHGEWPGMREGQLIGPGDLAVTTDYRDVLSEILTRRLNNEALSDIFPNHEPRMLGIIG